MQAFLAWLSELWDRLVPWVILDPWEAGIRIRCGRWVKDVGPGIHFTIPYLDHIESINVKKQWLAVQEQTVETADHIPMLLAATINYEIKYPRKLWLEVQDHDDSLAEGCAAALAHWVNRKNYDDINIDFIVAECYPEVRKVGFKWGCEILELGIKTWSKHRAYRIMMG